MRLLILLTCLFCSLSFFAQTPMQTVRGKVYDSETNFPLNAVKISIEVNDGKVYRTLSTADGTWEITKVPVGKHELSANYSFYDSKSMTIEVSSGRELILQIPLQEKISEQNEVKVLTKKHGEVINEMALLSAQQFSVAETNRYPGSRMDGFELCRSQWCR